MKKIVSYLFNVAAIYGSLSTFCFLTVFFFLQYLRSRERRAHVAEGDLIGMEMCMGSLTQIVKIMFIFPVCSSPLLTTPRAGRIEAHGIIDKVKFMLDFPTCSSPIPFYTSRKIEAHVNMEKVKIILCFRICSSPSHASGKKN